MCVYFSVPFRPLSSQHMDVTCVCVCLLVLPFVCVRLVCLASSKKHTRPDGTQTVRRSSSIITVDAHRSGSHGQVLSDSSTSRKGRLSCSKTSAFLKVYRMNLEEGRFISGFETQSPAVNRVKANGKALHLACVLPLPSWLRHCIWLVCCHCLRG